MQIVEQIEGGLFTPEQPDQLRDLSNMLRYHDRFMVCADFDSYVACQDKVGKYMKILKKNVYIFKFVAGSLRVPRSERVVSHGSAQHRLHRQVLH